MDDLTYILVPGLNDRKPLFEQFYGVLRDHWRRAGMDCVIAPMDWEGEEAFSEKRKRLELQIDTERKRGRRVVLVGVSAGASLAIAVFGARPRDILAVVSVGGLLALSKEPHEAAYINKSWYKAAKACEKAIAKMTDAQRHRVLTFSPVRDSVIDPSRQRLRGGSNRRIPSIGHVTSIAVCLLTRRATIKRFVNARRKALH